MADRARGAKLAAQRAVVLTITYPWHEPRREHSFGAGLEHRWLERVRGTDLQAFTTTDTPVEEFRLVSRTRRADQSRMNALLRAYMEAHR